MTVCTQLTVLWEFPRMHYTGVQKPKVGNHWEITTQFPQLQVLLLFERLRHFLGIKKKKRPGFFVQKMKRKWWWDSGSKASLTVCRYDYIWSIIGLNFWRLFEGKGSNQCLHGCREEWEEGMDESRCIILELEWIPVLLSSIADQPATEKMRKLLQNMEWRWREKLP